MILIGWGALLIGMGVLGILWEGLTSELEPGELAARLTFIFIGAIMIGIGFFKQRIDDKRNDQEAELKAKKEAELENHDPDGTLGPLALEAIRIKKLNEKKKKSSNR